MTHENRPDTDIISTFFRQIHYIKLIDKTYIGSEKLDYLSIVYFIFMINVNSSRSHYTDRMRTNKQPHEIKKVATFFNQRSPTITIEPVPIVDLQKAWASKNF